MTNNEQTPTGVN